MGSKEEGRNALLQKIAEKARHDINVFTRFVFRVEQASCHSWMQSHMSSERRAGILAHREFGKAQPKSTTIETPVGEKRFGDLKIGDELFSIDGRPTRLKAIYDRGPLPVYRVTFDDGSSTLACGDHLWTMRGFSTWPRKNSVTISTKELMAVGVLRESGKYKERQWELPSYSPVEYPIATLPIDPYILGVWIGDGVRLTGAYAEKNTGEIERAIRERGYDLGVNDYHIVRIHGIRGYLGELGLLDKYSYERFIPSAYKRSSVAQRKDLLRGLLDTDGFISKNGHTEYSTTSVSLARDVVWLVRSLGGISFIKNKVKKPFYRNEGGQKVFCRDCYRVTIKMSFNPFGLAAKRSRWTDPDRSAMTRRWMTRRLDRIEFEGVEDCRCIEVEHPSGLYLTNDFIVTHNTTQAMARLLWRIGNNPDIRIKIICGDDDTAVDRIMLARDMISRNRHLKLVFPSLKKNPNFDDWGKKSLTVDRPGFLKDSTLEGCGVMTCGTGQRADEILFDDVVTLQNAIAHPSQRDLVKQAFRSTWIPLLGPEGRAIYIATLYHEDDLSCDLKKNSEWKWLDFSVRGDPPCSPWRERWTEEALIKRKNEIGSLDFDRSMCNILHPDDERIVKEAWIRWFSTPPQRGHRIMSWDYAGGGKKSDYVARAVMDVDMTNRIIYILSTDRWRGMTFNEMITKILSEYDLWTPDVVLDEQAAFQIVVGTDERLIGKIPFRHIVPRLGKEERVKQTAVYYENGRILFREGFCKEGVEELLSFPHTKRDDYVDAITQGVNHAISMIGKSFSPEMVSSAIPRSIRMGMDLNMGPKSTGERDQRDTMRAGFREARW